MPTNDVKIRLVGENQASPAINKVKQDLGALDKAAGTAAGGLGALAKGAGVAGLVALGVKAAGAAIEIAKLGAASLSMGASFESMAGGAAQASSILDALTTASRGTIKEYDLMLTANRAMLLGVADSADEFGKLMEIATVRGRAMGLSTTQAFGDIVTGIGRMSPLILDNLGIVIDQAAAQEEYAATLGKSAKALSDAERKQALVNAVIDQSAGILATANTNADALAGEGFAQLDTAWGNFQATLGESLAPIFDARAKDVAQGVQSIIDAINNRESVEAASGLDSLLRDMQTRAEQSRSPLLDPQANLRFDPYPDQPIPEAPAIDKTYDEQAARIKFVQLALEQVKQAQAENIPGAEAWADKIQRVADRVVQFGEVSDASMRSVAVLLGDISSTTADQKLQEMIEHGKELGALTDAIKPDVAGPSAALALQNELQAMLSLYKDAQASFAAANAQGNTEAAAVAEGYVSRLVPAIREVVDEYNVLAKELGTRSIEGVFIGTGEVVYQTVEALEAQKQAAENAATAIDLLAQSGDKLGGLYDTLLDSGNIDGAASAFESIKGTMQGIVEEWLAQGKSIEEINDSLLPKLISELDGLIGAQIEAGDAGITAGELIGSGFLSSIPGISAVISAVAALTGNVLAAGNALGAVQGFTLTNWQWKDFQATGQRPPGLIGPAAKGWETPGPKGPQPLDNSRFGWFGAEADTFGGKSAADLQSERIRALAANQRNIASAGGSGLGGGGGGGGSSFDSALSSMASKVKSVLTGALKSGINLDDILPRQDAVEEPARRLADIAVRGFESPWVEYIKNTFPEIWAQISSSGDPKAAAASILRDFEDGLRPELLDKGRAKDLVKRALLGDQNTAALAAEIAAELSQELGVSLADAQAAAAGVLGSTGATDKTGETGMDGSTAAGTFTDSFVGAMNGMLERFKGAGNSAGSQWGAGFLATVEAGVPAQLISLLASLVTPGVQANLAAQGSRTGAS